MRTTQRRKYVELMERKINALGKWYYCGDFEKDAKKMRDSLRHTLYLGENDPKDYEFRNALDSLRSDFYDKVISKAPLLARIRFH